MRSILLIIIACAVYRSIPPRVTTEVVRVPVEPCRSVEPTPARLLVDHRAAWIAELEAVERELGSIDVAMIAAEHTAGATREEAQQLADARLLLASVRPADLAPDAPVLLVRLARLHQEAVAAHAALGPKHRMLARAAQEVVLTGGSYERQRDIEVAFGRAWSHELARLPETALPAEIGAARLRAIEAMLGTGNVPSDAPPDAVVAALELEKIRVRRDTLAIEYTTMHPSMLSASASVTRAEAELAFAIERAIDTLRRPPASTTNDGSLVARRAILTNRALTLHRLLGH